MQWLVLLEAERGSDVDEIDAADLRRLVSALADPVPGALHSAERYALQLEVDAPDAADAVRTAVDRWKVALRSVGLPRWELVRLEALTRAEFDQEFLACGGVCDDSATAHSMTDSRGESVDQALLRQAFYDPLTGLASQSLFCDDVDHALAEASGEERSALLLLDVDRFAELNEKLGPSAADTVLVAIARRVEAAAGPDAKVGRLGGDQFGVYLQAVTGYEASRTARRIVESVAAPIVLDGAEVRSTASVGVTMEENGDTGDDLLSRASSAVRTAQNGGGNGYEVFWQKMGDTDVRRLQVEREAMIAPATDSYLALLERVTVAITESPTLRDAGLAVLQQVCDHTGFAVGRLYLLDAGQEDDPVPACLWMVGAPQRFGRFSEDAARQPLRGGEGVAGQALASGTAVCVPDMAFEAGLAVPEETIAAGMRGALAVPVIVSGSAVAVLELFAEQPLDCCNGLVQLLTAIGGHLAAVARLSSAEAERTRAEVRLRVLLEDRGMYAKSMPPDRRRRE